ncbi:MAG: ABC-2 family transporter protein [Acidimicrobiales bacterium]
MADSLLQFTAYRRLLGARVRSEWQYRTSFALLLFAQSLTAALDFALIAVIFGRVDSLAGWSVAEVALLFGIGGIGFGLADVFVGQADGAAGHIKAGTFDQFLLRPMGPLLQLSAREFNLRRVGKVAQPALVLAIAVGRVDVDWTAARAALVPLALASGAAIFGSVWVITSSVAFWTVDTQEFANAFTFGGNHLVQYPIDVLGTWLRRFTIFVVPLAFVAYFPAAYLLDKPETFGPRALAWLSPVIAAVMVALARSVWTTAIRHYRSTGS